MYIREKFHIIPFFVFLFLVSVADSGYAAAPGLVQATPAMTSAVNANGYLQDGAGDLFVTGEYEAVPFVYDWDNDGKKDLLVGEDDFVQYGHVRFYKNIGTDADPLFNGFTRIRACNNTCDLSVPTGGS